MKFYDSDTPMKHASDEDDEDNDFQLDASLVRNAKFYAVARGWRTGIFRDWNTAYKATNRYKRVRHKSFSTLGGAEQYMQQYNSGENIHSDAESVGSNHRKQKAPKTSYSSVATDFNSPASTHSRHSINNFPQLSLSQQTEPFNDISFQATIMENEEESPDNSTLYNQCPVCYHESLTELIESNLSQTSILKVIKGWNEQQLTSNV